MRRPAAIYRPIAGAAPPRRGKSRTPLPQPIGSRPIMANRNRRRSTALAQLIALDLAGGGLWQAVVELDPARVFPYPDPLLDMVLQRQGQRRRVVARRRL